MTDLSSIHGIGKESLELLEAAGFLDAETLAMAGVDDLVLELDRANKILQITNSAPTHTAVGSWITAACKRVGYVEQSVAVSSMPANYEATAQGRQLLATAPLAIPLPASQLVENQLAVADIPPAILLNRFAGDLEIRVNARDTTQGAVPRAPLPGPSRPAASSVFVQLAEAAPSRLDIDVSRLRSVADLEKVGQRIPSSACPSRDDATPEDERVALIRSPLEATNRGRDPRTRSYVRGVLHTHPWGMTAGAIVTLLLAVLLPLAVVDCALLLLAVLFPDNFSWISLWFLVVPCSLPILGILYLIYGVGGHCRICTQRVFLPRSCRKNVKAHHLRGLGHIIPMCLHMVLFRWFRCTYCGTPVRLKK
ncbi:MAG: DUF4332 domain-containing protein [Verrucomicrobiota bacterium]